MIVDTSSYVTGNCYKVVQTKDKEDGMQMQRSSKTEDGKNEKSSNVNEKEISGKKG